jgi:ribonuclease D
MPSELLELLSNPNIIKVGVAIRDDLLGLKKLSAFDPKGFIELADLVKSMGVKSLGLRSMAGYFLRVKISKGAKLTNWENTNLKKPQLVYAATDAWIGKELYLHFISKNLIPK